MLFGVGEEDVGNNVFSKYFDFVEIFEVLEELDLFFI